MAIASFMFGITGTTLALIGFYYFMITDWPMNIGGKPNNTLYHNLPAFVPVMFEFTVFCAAHGMAITDQQWIENAFTFDQDFINL